MALILSRLYDALRLAKVPEDKAREAAEEGATYEQLKSDTYVPKWMAGVLIAVVLGVFWMQRQTIGRISDLQAGLSGLQVGLTTVQGQLVYVKGQLNSADRWLSSVEDGVGDLSNQLGGVKGRLGQIEARLSAAGGAPPQR